MNLNLTQLFLVLGLIVNTHLVFAEQEEQLKNNLKSQQQPLDENIQDNLWSGTIEYGVIATSGNTNTRSENAKASLEYKNSGWTNISSWSFLKASDSGVISADQTFVRNYTKYSVVNDNYLFLSLHFEKDRFSGFTTRTSETMGYGFALIKNDNFTWDVELGAGARQSTRTDGVNQDDLIARLGTNVSWQVNKNSQISEVLFMEKGKENTFVESLTTIKLKINDSLSLNLNLKIKNNSIVPANIKHTDSQTTINIVYDF